MYYYSRRTHFIKECLWNLLFSREYVAIGGFTQWTAGDSDGIVVVVSFRHDNCFGKLGNYRRKESNVSKSQREIFMTKYNSHPLLQIFCFTESNYCICLEVSTKSRRIAYGSCMKR